MKFLKILKNFFNSGNTDVRSSRSSMLQGSHVVYIYGADSQFLRVGPEGVNRSPRTFEIRRNCPTIFSPILLNF